MKLFYLLLSFAIALICLFSLQAVWFHYTYHLHSHSIEKSIDSIFKKAVEDEMNQRFLELEKNIKENFSDTDVCISSFNVDTDFNPAENNSVISQQYAMIQQLMEMNNIPFNLVGFDSIFHSLLQSQQYLFHYQINFIDSVGKTIETSGQRIVNGFKTTALPIINGEKIYAVVKISSPIVFKTMLAILSISILVVLLIITCLICETKIFINQYHLNRLRENFAQALTHDMKTPLATIYSVLSQSKNGIINKYPEQMQQKYYEVAIDQTFNLQAIVERILTLVSIEKKQLSLNKQPIDLPEMIQSLIDKFTVKSDKTIVFQTAYHLKDNCVYADPLYLQNAISNLIDNAIKYSGNSVEIKIECISIEKQVTIHAKDNGFGISFADQLKIFKKFERGAEIKRNRISGFGIGLNYVRQVIEAHGGKVAVFSKEGIGSDFVITLPSN